MATNRRNSVFEHVTLLCTNQEPRASHVMLLWVIAEVLLHWQGRVFLGGGRGEGVNLKLKIFVLLLSHIHTVFCNPLSSSSNACWSTSPQLVTLMLHVWIPFSVLCKSCIGSQKHILMILIVTSYSEEWLHGTPVCPWFLHILYLLFGNVSWVLEGLVFHRCLYLLRKPWFSAL